MPHDVAPPRGTNTMVPRGRVVGISSPLRKYRQSVSVDDAKEKIKKKRKKSTKEKSKTKRQKTKTNRKCNHRKLKSGT